MPRKETDEEARTAHKKQEGGKTHRKPHRQDKRTEQDKYIDWLCDAAGESEKEKGKNEKNKKQEPTSENRADKETNKKGPTPNRGKANKTKPHPVESRRQKKIGPIYRTAMKKRQQKNSEMAHEMDGIPFSVALRSKLDHAAVSWEK